MAFFRRDNNMLDDISLPLPEGSLMYEIEKAKEREQNGYTEREVELKEELEQKKTILTEAPQEVSTYESKSEEKCNVEKVEQDNDKIPHGEEFEIHKYNKKVENLIGLNIELKKELEIIQEQKNTEIETLREERKKIVSEKIDTEAKLHSVMQQNQSNLRELSLARKKYEDEKSKYEQAQQEISFLNGEIQKRVFEKNNAIQEMKLNLQRAEQSLNLKVQEIAELENCIRNIKQENNQEVDNLTELLKQSHENLNEEKLKRELSEQKLQSATKEIDSLKSELKKANENSSGNSSVFQVQIANLYSKLEKANSEMALEREKNNTIENELSAAQKTIVEMSKNLQNIKEMKDSEQSQLIEKLKIKKINKNIEHYSQNSPYIVKQFLNEVEFLVYIVLQEMARKDEWIICPKVRLANFIDVIQKKENYAEWKNYIKYRYIDFLICNKELSLLGGIELSENIDNDILKIQIFNSLNILFYRIDINKDIREQVIAIYNDIKNSI